MDDHRLRIILAAHDATGRVFKSVQGHLAALTKSVFSLQGSLATLAGGYGLQRVGGAALDVASSFEQMEIKLNQLTGGQGVQTLNEINQWALDMPVNTREAVDAYVMMKAMGLDPTIESMQTLVDTASIFGDDAMKRVARALGQMKTLGKLSAEEMNQMSEAGINARKYLEEFLGTTVEGFQKSGADIQIAIDAITKGLERDFGGAAKKAMNTWQGLRATTASYVTELTRMVMGAGVFDELKGLLREINAELKNWVENNEALIRQKTQETIAGIKDGIKSIWETYNAIPDEIVGAAGYGIIGRLLFGGGAGKVFLMLGYANEYLKKFNLDIGHLAENARAEAEIISNVTDVLAGRRDWRTGSLKGDALDRFNLGQAARMHTPGKTPDIVTAVVGDKATREAAAAAAKAELQKQIGAVLDTVEEGQALVADAHAKLWGGGYDVDWGGTDIDAAIDRMNMERSNQAFRLQQSIALQQAMAEAMPADGSDQPGGDYGDPMDAYFVQAEERATMWSEFMKDLNADTASAMGSTFSEMYFDLLDFKFDDMEGTLKSFSNMARRSIANALGGLTQTALFGGGAGGGTGFLGKLFGFQTGGISTGPETGYPALLHGTEAVVPLPDGRSIPVQMQGGTGNVINLYATAHVDARGATESDANDIANKTSQVLIGTIDQRLQYHLRPNGLLNPVG